MTRLTALFCLVTLTIAIAGAAREQDACDTPLGEGEVRQLIDAGVPAVRIKQLITTCGVDFGQPDVSALETRLRQLGAAATVIAALYPHDGASAGESWVSPLDRRTMKFVPAGQFQMGSPESESGRDPDESPHMVVVKNGFWMDIAEVTNSAYRQFVLSRPAWQKGAAPVDAVGSRYLNEWDGNAPPRAATDRPIVTVSWRAARAFCAWAGKRLPSEQEWEYAARAGTTEAYWWGDTFDPLRIRVPGDRTSEALVRRTNPWGMVDVTGSVWEWTATALAPYPLTSDGDDHRAPGRRSIRGGASANAASMLRVANRNSADADTASEILGVRCVQ